jgi:hypothetical protein
MSVGQEWTPEYVRTLLIRSDRKFEDAIAEEHNAALAAQREIYWGKVKGLEAYLEKAAKESEQQLASANDMWDRASRQADTMAEYLVDAKAELSVVKQQLAAERENQKLMVDALERITEWSVANQDKRYRLEMEWFGTPVCDAPNRIASDALAKVRFAEGSQHLTSISRSMITNE